LLGGGVKKGVSHRGGVQEKGGREKHQHKKRGGPLKEKKGGKKGAPLFCGGARGGKMIRKSDAGNHLSKGEQSDPGIVSEGSLKKGRPKKESARAPASTRIPGWACVRREGGVEGAQKTERLFEGQKKILLQKRRESLRGRSGTATEKGEGL